MATTTRTAENVRFRLRLALSLFIGGLVLSGVTAFPLLTELNLLVRWTDAPRLAASNGWFAPVAAWVLKVHDSLAATYAAYPFIAYGTDWLAFGHLIIALFFCGSDNRPGAQRVRAARRAVGLCAGAPARIDLRADPRHPGFLAVDRLFVRRLRRATLVVLPSSDKPVGGARAGYSPEG